MERRTMHNQITLIGNLGRDPEVKQTSKGGKYALLSVATHRKIKGEKQTDWHRVVCWDEKLADVLEKYTKAGSKLMLQGRLTYRTWDKEGQTIKTAEIHLDRFESRMELLDAKGESKSSYSEVEEFDEFNQDKEDIPF